MFICIYTHGYIRTYICIYLYMHIYLCIYTYIYIHNICIYIYAYTYMCTYVYVYTLSHAHTHVCVGDARRSNRDTYAASRLAH